MPNEDVFIKLNNNKIATSSKMRCEGGHQSRKWNDILNHGEGNATLHHMVPWEALGRVLALAVNEVIADATKDALLKEVMRVSQEPGLHANLARLKTALGTFRGLPGGSTPSKAKKIKVAVNDGFQPSSGRDSVDGNAAATSHPSNGNEDIVTLVHHWCWMPGNLFAGSPNRGDDPGSWGFDFPPADSKRMDKAGPHMVSGADSLKRYNTLYGFWRLVNTSTDAALGEAGAKRQELMTFLDELAACELWRPQRLFVAGFNCFEMKEGKPFKRVPAVRSSVLALHKDMAEEQKVHRKIQAVKNNHAEWSKANKANPYVKPAEKPISVEE